MGEPKEGPSRHMSRGFTADHALFSVGLIIHFQISALPSCGPEFDINTQWAVQPQKNLAMNSDHDSSCASCWPRRRKVKKAQEKAARPLVCVHCRFCWINHQLNLPSLCQKLKRNKRPVLCQIRQNMHSKQRKRPLTY